MFWQLLGGYLLPLTPGPLLPTTQYSLYGFLLQKPLRTGQSSAFRVPVSASMLISRARITEEVDQQPPQPHLAVAACSVGGLALLSRDKIARGLQGENPSLTASLQMSGTFSVIWLCDDHIVSLQTPKPKIREGTENRKITGKTLSIPCRVSFSRLAPSYLFHLQQCSWELEI